MSPSTDHPTTRTRIRLAVVVTALCLTMPLTSFAAGSPADAPSVAELLQGKGIEKYQLATYDAATLRQMVADVDAGQTITLAYSGVPYVLALYVNPIFTPEALGEMPNIRPYRGEVVGVPMSSVRVTVNLDENTIHGMIRLPSGTTYNLEPVSDGVGPAHVWYDSDDVKIPTGQTGVAPQPPELPQASPAAWPSSSASAAPLDPTSPVYSAVNESQPASVSPSIATGLYNSLRYRVYYDTGTNPTYIINRMDDHPWTLEVNTKIQINAVSAASTVGYPTPVTCGGGGANFLAQFASDHPLGGSEPNVDDRAMLFTNNAAINYNNFLGCAYMPGNHNWVYWTGTDKQKAIVADQELSHNFGLDHDCSTFANGHYSIMCGTYNGDAVTDESFLTASRNGLTPVLNTLPRVSKIFSGADTSADGVKLTWWEVRYPRSPTGGGIVSLMRTWTGTSTIALNPVFVGARNCATDTCNKDFGHYGPETVGPGLYPTHFFTYTLPSGTATWHFWPAYGYGGHWGPYKWKEVTFNVP